MSIRSLVSDPTPLVRFVLTLTAAALLGTIMALTYAGVFIWNLSILTDPILDNPYATGSPFTLAQVMAIFGAFGLVAGFSDHIGHELKRDMRRVAIYHFVSALCFCLLGLLLPAMPHAKEGTVALWILTAAILISISGAALSFSWGTVGWLSKIPVIIESKVVVESDCAPINES